jgi:hypothetical protein
MDCSPFHLKKKKYIYYPHIGCFLQHFLYVPIISNSKSGKDLWTLSGQWYGLKHAEDSFQASDNQCHGGSTWRMWRIWGPGWPPAVPAHFGYKGIAQYHRPDRFMARNGARHLNHETAKNVIDCVWIYFYIYIYYIYYIIFIYIYYYSLYTCSHTFWTHVTWNANKQINMQT